MRMCGIKTFECFVCKMKLKSQHLLEAHSQTHYRYENCVVCDTKLEENEIKQHLCAATDHINCDYCEQKCTSTKQLVEHLKSHNDNIKIYKCSKCSESFSMEVLTKIHHRHHKTNPKSFACTDCTKAFEFPEQLRSHRYTAHANGNKGGLLSVCSNSCID